MTRAERSFRVVPNDPTELRPLSRWALEAVQGLGLPANLCHDVDLCLHEAVSNIMRHGGDGPCQVTIRIETAAMEMLVQVEDDARPFDPVAEPAPPEAGGLAEARTSGYGIPLLRALTRELRYERSNGRNRLTLVFDTCKGD